MIWLWISAAVILSWLFCRRKVAWYHYIWILLPIEMYGIQVAGATLKPYMLFGLLLIAKNVFERRTQKVPLTFLAVALMLTISDILTGFILASVMQHLMFLFVIFIGLNYLSYQSDGIEFEEMGQAALAATIGYGIVFIIAWLTFQSGLSLQDVYAYNRFDTGIVLRLTSYGGLVSSRLRGFCIDPNSVITTLIPGGAYAIANIVYRKTDIIKSTIALAVYSIVVIYSGSRMAVICTLAMLVLFFFIAYNRAQNKLRAAAFGLIAIAALLSVFIISADSIILDIATIWNDTFGERATLQSEYGRFSIWKSNISYLFQNHKALFGVGQNQIYLLTTQKRACHNTWLEWICGTGVFFGTIIDCWFLFALRDFRKRVSKIGSFNAHDGIPVITAYIIVIICISTVDNITNSVLLFLMLTLRYGVIENDSLQEGAV